MKVTVFVAIMQLEVPATLMQVKVSAANLWVTIFTEITQVGVSLVIMQVVLSTVHYAHDCFYCNYAGDCFCCSHTVTVLSSNFMLFLCHPFFCKIGQKTFESIISSLHFTALGNILPKLRYFVGRIYIQIS